MSAETMLSAEHRQLALEFLMASDSEFKAGDILQGAEKLWSAAAHAVMVVAQERGWPHESHRSLKNATIRLSEELDDQFIRGAFGAAEKFLRCTSLDSMEDWEIVADRPLVREFVERVLRVAEL